MFKKSLLLLTQRQTITQRFIHAMFHPSTPVVPSITHQSKRCTNIQTLTTIKFLPQYTPNISTVFLDIDETILIPKTQFIYGQKMTDNFLRELRSQHPPITFQKICDLMEKTYYGSEITLVEEELTKRAIRSLKRKRCKIFGITSNNANSDFAKVIIKSLDKFGIKFTRGEQSYQLEEGCCFNGDLGIFFTSYHDKGLVLIDYLKNRASFRPEHVVFVDDSLSKCIKVQEAFRNSDINISIFHYVAAERLLDHQKMMEQYASILKEVIDNKNEK